MQMTSPRTAASCDEQPSRRQRYEAMRERHCWEVQEHLPDHLDRLSWTADRLRDERERRLRALLRAAADRSPWHRQRLAGLDLDRITEDDLGAIPPMTKDNLMDNFDQIVIAPGITRDLVEAHIASLNEDANLLDHYHAVASGGSSGQRGIFVYDWTGWVDAYLGMVRYMFWPGARAGRPLRRAVRMAVVAAGRASHMSSALPQTFTDPARMTVRRFPISLPLPQIVAGLNATQPDVLLSYPTALRELADEAIRGNLSIAPRIVISVSEPLLPEVRATVEAVWGVTVQNW